MIVCECSFNGFFQIPSSPASAVSGDQPDPSTDDDEIGKGKNQIGVPNIIIQALNPQQSMMDAVLNEQILPSFDEVLFLLVPVSAIYCIYLYLHPSLYSLTGVRCVDSSSRKLIKVL